MPTGYEVAMYRHIEQSAKALGSIATELKKTQEQLAQLTNAVLLSIEAGHMTPLETMERIVTLEGQKSGPVNTHEPGCAGCRC